MNSPASTPREEMLTTEQPASPPSIRYPLSAPRYLWTALLPARKRPKDGETASPLSIALPRRMKRRARALMLLWIPFWYILGQLSLFAWMDERWEMERTISERRKWELFHERMAQTPDLPLVLFVGSSRTDQAFQAGRLTGQRGPDGQQLMAFNMGVPTMGAMHEALYLNDVLAEGIRPRLLLVEFVSTHFNRSQRGLQSEEHFTLPARISAHQLLFLQRYFTNRRRAMIEWMESRVTPWYAYRWHIHEHLKGNHTSPQVLEAQSYDQSRRPIDPWGWRILRDLPDTPAFRAYRCLCANNMYGMSLQRFQLGAKPCQAMHDLLARCRKEKIPVALVLMPVSQEFRDMYCPEAREQLGNFVVELRQRYNLDIIDATEWLDKEDFDDGHHVLTIGAEKFTTRIIDEVHKLLASTEPKGKKESTP
jgi:hypothetical protein